MSETNEQMAARLDLLTLWLLGSKSDQDRLAAEALKAGAAALRSTLSREDREQAIAAAMVELEDNAVRYDDYERMEAYLDRVRARVILRRLLKLDPTEDR